MTHDSREDFRFWQFDRLVVALLTFVFCRVRFKEENALNAKNTKRESKTYSYKEQMEELELKKELNRKKLVVDSRKLDLDGLTPKQKEIVRLELEKEEGIRLKLEEVGSNPLGLTLDTIEASDELLQVRGSFLNGPYSQLTSLLTGNVQELSKHLVQLLPDLLKLLRSPLIAGLVADTYANLRTCAFSGGETAVLGRGLDLLNAGCTLRALLSCAPGCS